MPITARWAWVALLAAGASACGGGTSSPVAIPPTTPTTLPSGPTVPAFGAPASVLAPTAPDATANASGACSRFSTLYIELAQGPVGAAAAAQAVAQVAAFADAAAAGDASQWRQLRVDVDGLSAATATPAWTSSGDQSSLPAVRAVVADCRPLQ